jgi:hypothetical protein
VGKGVIPDHHPLSVGASRNKARGNRKWFYPKDTPRPSAITKKSAENAATIEPGILRPEAAMRPM